MSLFVTLGTGVCLGQIGTVGMEGSVPADLGLPSYSAIAHKKAAIVERTGLLGEGSVWAGPHVVAKFFIAGFGDAEQRTEWLPRIAAGECVASVAISEPRVGAHPKHLSTQAVAVEGGFRISGEKAWVTNGPIASVFIVLAITAIEEGRKRYSAFLVPRDAERLRIKEAPEYQALSPSRHCGLVLDGCLAPHSARLGPLGSAYEAMALPFRDVEDAVGTFGLLGAFRFLLTRLDHADDQPAMSLGALAGLVAVFGEAAEAVMAALDTGRLADMSAAAVGLHVLAADIVQRARAHREAFGPTVDEKIDQVIADLETSLSVARGPRAVRQARLGRN